MDETMDAKLDASLAQPMTHLRMPIKDTRSYGQTGGGPVL
jgi:hypothetical protein